MIDILYSIVLGAVQGLTEFLPISSSGHLIVLHDILRFGFADNLSFDVALHLGTLAALLIYFWRDVRRYIVAFVRSFANFQVRTNVEQRLAWLIVIGTIPAAVVGYFWGDIIEAVVRSLGLVAVTLILVGILFFAVERLARRRKGLEELTWGNAIAVGIAQAAALIPGVSRSGATILAGMTLGLSRRTAARFSFLLSIPIVFAAGAKTMLDAVQEGIASSEWALMAVGFITSAVVGYLVIRWLLKFLGNHRLDVFGYYRIALGIALLVYAFVS